MVIVELRLQLRNNLSHSAGSSEEKSSLPIGLYGHCQATYGSDLEVKLLKVLFSVPPLSESEQSISIRRRNEEN